MAVLFDTDTARLRLDRDTFDALVAWLRGAGGDRGRLEELRSSGVIEGGQPHPALIPGFEAITDALIRLSIQMRDGNGRSERGEGWVSGEAVAILLDLPGGLCEFLVIHPIFLPAGLAKVVQLGPRLRPVAVPVQVKPELLELLTDSNPAVREAAADRLVDSAPNREVESAMRAMIVGLHRSWYVATEWVGPDGTPGSRALHVLDTDAGLWVVEPRTEVSVVWPTTPTAVFRALTRLLPNDNDLA
jgi:hypothetical protein